MDLGIKTFMDLLEAVAYFAQVVAAGAVFVIAVAYALNRKQLNFDIMTSCTARWQEIMLDLERALEGHSKGEAVRSYLRRSRVKGEPLRRTCLSEGLWIWGCIPCPRGVGQRNRDLDGMEFAA